MRRRPFALRETGTIYKDPGGRITIALLYPNTIPCMSSLGFQGIYGLLNSMPMSSVNGIFCRPPRILRAYTERERNLFYGIERPLADLISSPFRSLSENDYAECPEDAGVVAYPAEKALTAAHYTPSSWEGRAFYTLKPMSEFIDICSSERQRDAA